MYRRILFQSFKADMKFIARDPMLLIASLAPFIIMLFLRLGFPVLSEIIYTRTAFNLENYYPVIAITIVSVIPMLFGFVFAFILLDESDSQILQVIEITPAGKRNFVLMRLITPFLMSLGMLLVCNFVINPVPYEGWLRTIYVTLLLSLQAPFVFLFIGSLANNKVEGFALSKLFGVFVIAVPLGLLLHHPWNYLAFFSPLYWIAWSWIITLPAESLFYGIISAFITIVGMYLFLRKFLIKHA